MTARLAIFGALAIGLSACGGEDTAKTPQPKAATPAPAPAPQQQATGPVATAPANTPEVPHVYMAIQPGGNGPTSVVFAIDQSQDNTPTNDPAIRITPEEGKCNPQQLRGYGFTPRERQRPIYGPDEVRTGVLARDLPNFMAMAVTSEMLRSGLVVDPEASKPQNVCTRKLFESLILQQSNDQG
ncbi:MAG: hypothetical protein AAFV19_02525 [Pseudomonadota bacterium]